MPIAAWPQNTASFLTFSSSLGYASAPLPSARIELGHARRTDDHCRTKVCALPLSLCILSFLLPELLYEINNLPSFEAEICFTLSLYYLVSTVPSAFHSPRRSSFADFLFPFHCFVVFNRAWVFATTVSVFFLRGR